MKTFKYLREQQIKEGMSKPMPLKVFAKTIAVDKKEEQWILDNEDDFGHYYNNSALKKSWLSLSYPINDGDYYFAFISDNIKKNSSMNSKMNAALKKEAKKESDVENLFYTMDKNYFDKLPRDLGASDTMTREELYRACKHIMGVKVESMDEGKLKDIARKLLDRMRKKKMKVGESVDERRYGKSMSYKEIMRKHGNEFKKVLRSSSLDMSDKAEEDLIQYVYDNHPEEIRTDDPDEWLEWLEDNLEDFVKGRGY